LAALTMETFDLAEGMRKFEHAVVSENRPKKK
jgi:hypothetical protein